MRWGVKMNEMVMVNRVESTVDVLVRELLDQHRTEGEVATINQAATYICKGLDMLKRVSDE